MTLRDIPFTDIRDEYIVRLGRAGFQARTIAELVDETVGLDVSTSTVYNVLRKHQVSLRTYRRAENEHARETIAFIDRKVFGRRRRRAAS